MLRILHIADLHLGYRRFGDLGTAAPPQLRDSILERLASFLTPYSADSLGLSKKIDLLLIAGDLFDNQCPEEALVSRVMTAIKRIQDLGVTVITVPGNHDEISYPDSVYRRYEKEWPGLLVTNREPEAIPLVVSGRRTVLVSMAYDAAYKIVHQPLDSFPERHGESLHLCLLHAAFSDKAELSRGTRTLLLDREAILGAGYDYIALGHQHRAEVLSYADEKGLLAYPGMIAPRLPSDPGDAQLLFVELERGLAPRYDWIPFPQPAVASSQSEPTMPSEAQLRSLALNESPAGALARCYLRDLAATGSQARRELLPPALQLALASISSEGEVRI